MKRRKTQKKNKQEQSRAACLNDYQANATETHKKRKSYPPNAAHIEGMGEIFVFPGIGTLRNPREAGSKIHESPPLLLPLPLYASPLLDMLLVLRLSRLGERKICRHFFFRVFQFSLSHSLGPAHSLSMKGVAYAHNHARNFRWCVCM